MGDTLSITNATLAADLKAMVAQWTTREREMVDWLAGTVTGGPDSNGSYPLTDALGNVQIVPCPAKINAMILDLTSGAQAFANAASASATASSDSASTATTKASESLVSASEALMYASNANTYKSTAGTHEANCQFLFDDFNAWYLGAFASAPLVDNKGLTLRVGALYFNTTDTLAYVWTGSTWNVL